MPARVQYAGSDRSASYGSRCTSSKFTTARAQSDDQACLMRPAASHGQRKIEFVFHPWRRSSVTSELDDSPRSRVLAPLRAAPLCWSREPPIRIGQVDANRSVITNSPPTDELLSGSAFSRNSDNAAFPALVASDMLSKKSDWRTGLFFPATYISYLQGLGGRPRLLMARR